MPDKVLTEDEQAQLDFDSAATETLPPKQAVEVKVETPPQAKPPAQDAPPVKPVAKYVQLTEEQFNTFKSAAEKTAAFEGQISKLFGTTGDMQQIVRKLQAATPAGHSVEIPKGALAKTRKDFPELADLIESDLVEALKGVRGTAPETPAKPALDDDAIQKLVEGKAREFSRKNESEALEDTYANWREIVGPVDAEGRYDPNNEYRKWLGAQDQAYQTLINSTDSAQVIARSIGRFLAFKSHPTTPASAPKIAARTDRIKAAIQPRGDGGQPAPAKSADDDFNAGFAQG